MICPKCGTVCDDNSKFCPVCGEQLQAQPQQENKVSYCPKCGQPHEGNPPYCPSCGAPLSSQNAQESAQNFSQNANQTFSDGNMNQYFTQSQPGIIPTRSIPLYVVLTILTCGLFGIYWLIMLVNDLNIAAGTPNDTSGAVVVLLEIVTCNIYGVYWMYKAGEKVSILKNRRGVPSSGNDGIFYLILQLLGLGIINYCLIQNELNQIAARQ